MEARGKLFIREMADKLVYSHQLIYLCLKLKQNLLK